jgi:hypothetical protein
MDVPHGFISRTLIVFKYFSSYYQEDKTAKFIGSTSVTFSKLLPFLRGDHRSERQRLVPAAECAACSTAWRL